MPHSVMPYWIRDTQPWAVEQERMRHTEALYQLGELAFFALMWHLEDFTNGLVDRCPTCYSAQGKIADAYGQGNQYRCPDCFGTTFRGGYKALIIRPTIFSDTDKDLRIQSRGVTSSDEIDVESTPDFRVRTGDYVFRATGDRLYLRVPSRITIRSGFSVPWQTTEAVGYSHAKAVIEDLTDVSYTIPPDNDRVTEILTRVGRVPTDQSKYEVIRAPLIPETIPPPPEGVL